jgi:hypothetical protein
MMNAMMRASTPAMISDATSVPEFTPDSSRRAR